MATFTEIAMMAPVDRVAARGARAGTHHEVVISEHGEMCRKDRPTTLDEANPGLLEATKRNHDFKDYTGIRWGNFTVVGLSVIAGSSEGSVWVVRCDCGNYSTRRNKAIRNQPQNGQIQQCRECTKKAAIPKDYARAQWKKQKKAARRARKAEEASHG